MKKTFSFINALLILSILAGDVIYLEHGTLRIKAIVSLLFTLLGAVNLIYAFMRRCCKIYPAILLAGLTFSMLGDIGLHYNFIKGAGLFAFGHVLFFIAFCSLMKFRPADLVPPTLLFAGAAALLLFYPRFRFGNNAMRNVCLAYALIISIMAGKSISNLIRGKNILLAVAAIGSMLFFASDLMLALYQFARLPRIFDTLCLIFYYPAQCALGFSGFLYVNRAVRH